MQTKTIFLIMSFIFSSQSFSFIEPLALACIRIYENIIIITRLFKITTNFKNSN